MEIIEHYSQLSDLLCQEINIHRIKYAVSGSEKGNIDLVYDFDIKKFHIELNGIKIEKSLSPKFIELVMKIHFN